MVASNDLETPFFLDTVCESSTLLLVQAALVVMVVADDDVGISPDVAPIVDAEAYVSIRWIYTNDLILFSLMIELNLHLTIIVGSILHLCCILDFIGVEQELPVLIYKPVKPETLSRSQYEHITNGLVVHRNLDTKM